MSSKVCFAPSSAQGREPAVPRVLERGISTQTRAGPVSIWRAPARADPAPPTDRAARRRRAHQLKSADLSPFRLNRRERLLLSGRWRLPLCVGPCSAKLRLDEPPRRRVRKGPQKSLDHKFLEDAFHGLGVSFLDLDEELVVDPADKPQSSLTPASFSRSSISAMATRPSTDDGASVQPARPRHNVPLIGFAERGQKLPDARDDGALRVGHRVTPVMGRAWRVAQLLLLKLKVFKSPVRLWRRIVEFGKTGSHSPETVGREAALVSREWSEGNSHDPVDSTLDPLSKWRSRT